MDALIGVLWDALGFLWRHFSAAADTSRAMS
jgi:hypothetical protein